MPDYKTATGADGETAQPVKPAVIFYGLIAEFISLSFHPVGFGFYQSLLIALRIRIINGSLSFLHRYLQELQNLSPRVSAVYIDPEFARGNLI